MNSRFHPWDTTYNNKCTEDRIVGLPCALKKPKQHVNTKPLVKLPMEYILYNTLAGKTVEK